MADEPKKTYQVKEGQVWGTNPELQAGDTVELTAKEAAGFLDKLAEVGGQEGAPATKTETAAAAKPTGKAN